VFKDQGYHIFLDPKGWEYTKPGWYEASANMKYYHDIIDWITTNIGKYERHTRWNIMSDEVLKVKFRYQRDCMLFMLRWS
jgi:hypothetical protein